MLKFLKFIFSIPFVALLDIVLSVRNILYDFNILSSKSYKNLTLISIGNLSFGGTGKSPHVEYLIQLLHNSSIQNPEIATLSRGYGRKTKGFFLVQEDHTSIDVGDEPLQFKHKFPNIPVAVDEQRQRGIEKLTQQYPTVKVIILDDAFQHRKISPDLSILLTDYSNLYVTDYLFPLGTLREPRRGFKRADIIIITKGSKFISPLEQRTVKDKLNVLPHQKVFFSYVEYQNMRGLFNKNEELSIQKIAEDKTTVILITGIAKSTDLEYYLKENGVKNFIHLKYPDHYYYTEDDIRFIEQKFHEISHTNKIILTTEKDSKRLIFANLSVSLQDLPVFYIPIKINFAGKDGEEFNKVIQDYVRRNKVNSEILIRQNEI